MTTTTRLDWRPASPHMWTATGIRGTYRIQQVDPATWTLYGREPGGLSMMALPVTGKAFDSLNGAQRYADGIDRMPPCGEMSGS